MFDSSSSLSVLVSAERYDPEADEDDGEPMVSNGTSVASS